MYNERIKKVINGMEAKGINQIIISSTPAIFYLTGKWIESGERMLALYINTKGDKKLVINELFPLKDVLGIELCWYNDIEDPIKVLCKIIDNTKTIAIDKTWPSHFLIKLMENKAATGFVNGAPFIDRVRMLKDQEEIKLMKKASKINDEVMGEIFKKISGSKTEKQMCAVLADLYEAKGAQGFSFDPIIAYGANGADPHHSTDNTVTLKKGECVIVDIGCRNEFYCSDMTRTFFFGEPSEKAKEIYEIVKQANLKGIAKVKPGVKFCEIDKAAREYIEECGYGKYFTHRTGHSIGIETHDFGDVSSINEDVVKPGMIFSIEPGIYLPGEVGVRIEDLVLVTEDGCEVLNNYSKDLTIIK